MRTGDSATQLLISRAFLYLLEEVEADDSEMERARRDQTRLMMLRAREVAAVFRAVVVLLVAALVPLLLERDLQLALATAEESARRAPQPQRSVLEVLTEALLTAAPPARWASVVAPGLR
ncbi:hypothetical protein [Streptomyces hydrogenans]|uniref:hypothetical protein n=1 Tax=Streptomyces hydrogenans TaxID=1873719 RepID=UPI00382DFBAC